MATRTGTPRVVVVGPTYPVSGGVAAHTTELCRRADARGWDVELVAWERTYPSALYRGHRVATPPPDVPAYPSSSRPLRWDRPWSWRRVGRQCAVRDPDAVLLVHVMPVQVPALVALAAGVRDRSPNARLVALCHNVLPHERHPGDTALTRGLLRRVDAALVHTPQQRVLATALGAPEVAVAPLAPHLPGAPPRCAVDVDASPHVEAPDGRDPEGGVRLLFFGMVRDYKGLDVLLDALPAVPGVSLTVAGEHWGDAGRRLERRLGDDPALAARVRVRPGYVPAEEVPSLFAVHDVLALPYRSGTASQNVDLAFTHGLPVLATDVGSFPDQVRDGCDGFLVPADDAPALAVALRRLAEPGVLARLRSGVRPPDAGSAWDAYLAALEGLTGTRPLGSGRRAGWALRVTSRP